MYVPGSVEVHVGPVGGYGQPPTDSSSDDDERFTPCAWLPHSCDEWVIGGPAQVRALIEDLQEALGAMGSSVE